MFANRSCAICGGNHFSERKVLWPELIATWELNPQEVETINRQQGRACIKCGSQWRCMALASAIMSEWNFEGLFQEFVADRRFQSLRILEINGAGTLSPWLARLPGRQLVEYPAVDMQSLPFKEGAFDLVIHSDTLEHVPDPDTGLQECRRVLVPGGRCIFTIPIVVGRMTRDCRNRPASYHGDPSHPEDNRVHTEFGADAWCWPLRAGFEDCRIHGWEFPSSLAIVARRATRTEPGRGDIASDPPRTQNSGGTQPPAVQPNLQWEENPEISTGERLIPTTRGAVVEEHLHRYALAVAWSPGRDVLDVACGEGYGSNLLAAQARSVIGIDIDDGTISRAQKKYQRPNLRFQTGDCRKLPLPDASIDLAVSFETVEHIQEQASFLKELRRVLRPHGVLLISTPDPAVYHAGQAPNPFHVRELPRQEFLSLLRTHFQTVSWADQRIWNGSLIVPESSSNNPGGFQSITGDFSSFQYTAGLAEPMYMVAAATNGPSLPEWVWGAFSSQNSSDLVTVTRLEAELNALRHSTSWRLTAPLRWLSDRINRRS